MQILNSGNVSIGNTNDTYKLDVSGTSRITGNATFGGTVYATEYDLPSGGRLDWANGDARIVEGLVNNYSLSFQTYDGSNITTALRLDGNNSATFAGQLNVQSSLSAVVMLEPS